MNAGDRLAEALADVGIVGATVEDRGPTIDSWVKVKLSHAEARKLIDLLNERRER